MIRLMGFWGTPFSYCISSIHTWIATWKIMKVCFISKHPRKYPAQAVCWKEKTASSNSLATCWVLHWYNGQYLLKWDIRVDDGFFSVLLSTFFVDLSTFHYFIGQIIISFAGFNPLPTPSCYSRVWSIAYLLVLLLIPHLLVMSPCLLLLSWCTTNLYQWSLDSCLPKSLIPFLLVWCLTLISHYCFYPLLYFTILHHTLPKNNFVFVASSGFSNCWPTKPHHCWDEHPVERAEHRQPVPGTVPSTQ